MTYLTDEEIYQRVRTHLLSQMELSTHAEFCAYRGDHGRKCAIGCLIPDEHYQKTMEGRTVGELFQGFPSEIDAAGLSKLSLHLLVRLQTIHDGADSPKEWLRVLPDDYQAFLAQKEV